MQIAKNQSINLYLRGDNGTILLQQYLTLPYSTIAKITNVQSTFAGILVSLWTNGGLMPITFYIQSNKRPAPVYVRFREGRKIDAKARTKFAVNPEDWSAAKGKAKETDERGKHLNWELEKFRKALIDKINRRAPNEQVTTQWLKDFINPTNESTALLSYFEKYIEEKKRQVKEGKISPQTIKKCEVNRKLLQRMGENVLIEDFNLAFVNRFKEYCTKNGYSTNTIVRAVKYLITICRDARKNGLITHPDLDHIKEKPVKSIHIYLTEDELKKIQDAELPEYLDNARDWLLISCYTGQRISDFMRFNKEMLKEEKGKLLLEFTQVKTKKIMTVPVHVKIKAILEKRKGDFPRQISDQKYNNYIKDVCKSAGITHTVYGSRKNKKTNRKESGTFQKWELVSSHIGRRTFATNFFGIIPTSLLMFVTGHSTEAQFYAYIGKAERTKAFQLADYF